MSEVQQIVVLKKEMLVNGVFVVTVLLPNAEGEMVERKLRVSNRPGWKESFDEFAKKDELTNIPRYQIRVENFPFVKGNYNGTGAIWYRSDEFASGTFQWRDKTYDVTRALVEVAELTGEGDDAVTVTKKRDVFSIKEQVVEVVNIESDIYA